MITWGHADSTWEVWKGKVTEVENKTIGRTKRMKNYRQFWDKELDQFLQRRREANRLRRIHDKNHSADSTLGSLLDESYRKRKEMVQSAIRRKETSVKMRNFHRKCTTAKNISRGFGGFLKGDHRNRTVSEIVDPVDKNLILDEQSDRGCFATIF